MRRRFLKFPRARIVALAIGVGALGSLATATASYAAFPKTGADCQTSDGKISGRGATLQTYGQTAFITGFANDVCGDTPAMSPAEITADGFPGQVTGTGGTGVSAGTQAGDPTDSSNPVFPILGTQPTFAGDQMLTYNYPSAYGSGGSGSTSGRTAISCRTDAYGASDIPYVKADFNAISGAPGGFPVEKGKGPTGGSNTNCIPTATGWTETPPFTPTADTGAFTNDTGGQLMSFPVLVSAIAIDADLKGISGCPQPGSGPALSTADVLNIWGGNYTNWDQITDEGTTWTGCNQTISRVVRQDSSGTTQGFLNYLADANAGGQTGTPVTTCQTGVTFATMQSAIVNTGNNNGVTWPQGGSCTPVDPGATSGGPALLSLLESTPGGVGYADISDSIKDANAAADLTISSVTNAAGTQEFPSTGGAAGTGASDCSTVGDTNLPSGSQWAGANGSWALDFLAGSTVGFDDVSYSGQGASDYPACTLSWDFLYQDEDGNTATPTTSVSGAGQTTSGNTLAVTSVAGFPASGAGRKLTVSLGGGAAESAIATYTGVNTTTNTFTGVVWSASPVGGQTTGVAPQPASIPAGASVQQYGVDPVAYLKADQRRTLYSYFTYVLSDLGQANLAAAGYAALPEFWLTSERAQFDSLF
jgi:hypothetical protein